MNIQYIKHYSACLDRYMEYKIYGHCGKPVMFIPCQCGRFFDFENFHMLDHWAKWIEAGECIVFSVDCIDGEAWAGTHLSPRQRIENHERWYNYIVEELVPAIRQFSGRKDILTFGCSLGAMHAANLFFRRPDLFDSVFAISGLYDSLEFFGEYMDGLVYNNSPVTYLANMPAEHPYLMEYAKRKMLFSVGQGAWEGPLLESTRRLDTVCAQKGIPARFEYWGFDVNHDWPWWFKMVKLYVPELLGIEV
jgi:esterase/lipase superfamily enzyme